MKARLPLLVVAVCMVWVGTVFAGDSPRDWLDRLSSAMSQMSYQGTFVYEQGSDLVTMRITHVVDDSGVRERLFSLSGAPREVIRDAKGVRWVRGDVHAVLTDAAFKRSFFPRLPVDSDKRIPDSYTMEMSGRGRVAAQAVRGLEILPNDGFRYGYRLWLEDQSALLLAWELIDSKRRSLARLMFTDIRMGSEVDHGELRPGTPIEHFALVESDLPAENGQTGRRPEWAPGNLPPGFELINQQYSERTGPQMFEHLLYSDGLAAVSVYVDGLQGDKDPAAGLSRLGTTHAFTRRAEGVMITVIGDVPAETVQLIGNAVAPAAR